MPDEEAPERTPTDVGAFALFAHDVRRSLRIWQRDPRLPIAALGLALFEGIFGAIGTASGDTGIGLIGGLLGFVFLGFYGTQRVWYVAADHGERLAWREIRELTGRLWKRYFGLGVYIAVVAVAIAAVPFAVVALTLGVTSLAATLLWALVFLVVDASITFATATLPFAEYTAGQAVRHSLAVVREQWPACAYYVLLPPLAIQMILRVVPQDELNVFALLGLQMVTATIALVCRGATMLFYADRYLAPRQE
jgi:hypothetical protein